MMLGTPVQASRVFRACIRLPVFSFSKFFVPFRPQTLSHCASPDCFEFRFSKFFVPFRPQTLSHCASPDCFEFRAVLHRLHLTQGSAFKYFAIDPFLRWRRSLYSRSRRAVVAATVVRRSARTSRAKAVVVLPDEMEKKVIAEKNLASSRTSSQVASSSSASKSCAVKLVCARIC